MMRWLWQRWSRPRSASPAQANRRKSSLELESLESRVVLSRIQFASAAVAVGEGVGSAVVTVTRNDSAGTASVDYSVSADSAKAGSDFSVVAGRLTFGPGVTSQSFAVPVIEDALPEGNENLRLSLGNPSSGSSLGDPRTATLTIVDNDLANTFQFQSSRYSAQEGGPAVAITVVRTNPTPDVVSVQYQTSGGTASAENDYVPVSGTLTFGPGELAQSFLLPIREDDFLPEDAETIRISLGSASPGAAVGSPSTTTVTVAPAPAAPAEVLEQWFVYLLNQARSDPAGYQAANALPADFSGIQASQPLAINSQLGASARFRSYEMATNDYFAHQSPVTGKFPNVVARDFGYPLASAYPNDANSIESLAAGYFLPADALNVLLVDAGVPDLSHRLHLLGVGRPDDREVGAGFFSSSASRYGSYWTVHTATTDASTPFLTGVVYNDVNANGVYDPYEGVGGVTITAGGTKTSTNAAGGWSIPVKSNQSYEVVASGLNFGGTSRVSVRVGTNNLEVDFISGRSGAMVNFAPASTASLPIQREGVAWAIAHSVEAYQSVVHSAYQRYLGRSADPVGLNYWTESLRMGLPDEVLEAALIASPEYIQRSGGGESWVRKLYEDLLGRPSDSAGRDFWTARLADGFQAFDIALTFAFTLEHQVNRVTAVYNTFLGRAANQEEVSYWATQLVSGVSDMDMLAAFVSSPEYYNNGQHGKGDPGEWIRSMHRDLFRREATDAEVSWWLDQVAATGRVR